MASYVPDETLRESALDVFDRWPDAVTDRDGTTITLVHNLQGNVDALFDHLTSEGAGNEFSRQRTQWLPLIPTTIQEARIKLLDSDNRSWMYVAKYDSGDRHMVVVKPDGTLRSQQLLPENANLWTHFQQRIGGIGRYRRLTAYWLGNDKRPITVSGSRGASPAEGTSPDKSTSADQGIRAHDPSATNNIGQTPPPVQQKTDETDAGPSNIRASINPRRSAGSAEREITQLIHDQQIHFLQRAQQSLQPILLLRFFQLIDQTGGGKELHPLASAARRLAQCHRQVRLARAAARGGRLPIFTTMYAWVRFSVSFGQLSAAAGKGGSRSIRERGERDADKATAWQRCEPPSRWQPSHERPHVQSCRLLERVPGCHAGTRPIHR